MEILCLLLVILISRISDCDGVTFNGTIAGNRSISECLSGGSKSDSDMYITPTKMLEKLGYPVEEHVVVTNDGHILTVHRIPAKPNATAILLQHGLLCSSFDFIVGGKGKALALILADEGYDVWMPNARGNTYSLCHTKYTTSQFQFWDFSWHEMGTLDLPAAITYVTDETNQRVIYIGHSQGTTSFYVMAAERPDIASKVKVMFSLSPVVYLTHAKSFAFIILPIVPFYELYFKFFGEIPTLHQTYEYKLVVKYFCSEFRWTEEICVTFLGSVFGFDNTQFNYPQLPLILYHFPAGSSLKAPDHYAQVHLSKKFRKFDYGKVQNFEMYGNSEPPEYNLSKITLPIGLFWSENDYFGDPRDVQRFYEELPNVILNYKIEDTKFNHQDYYWNIYTYRYVYSKLLSVMENYR